MLKPTTSLLTPPANFIAQFGSDEAKLLATLLWVILMIAMLVAVATVVIVGLIHQPALTTAGGSAWATLKALRRFWPW